MLLLVLLLFLLLLLLLLLCYFWLVCIWLLLWLLTCIVFAVLIGLTLFPLCMPLSWMQSSCLSYLFSPNFMSRETYSANRLCLYCTLPCPHGCMQQLFWTPGEFQLEPGFGGSPFCLDYIKFNLEGFSLDVGDYRLHGSRPFLFGAGAGILWH